MKIFEIIMLICFGMAWPINIYKSLKSKSVKGKSFVFMIAICIGYVSGIINKCLNGIDYVLPFYILNLVMVLIDIVLYLYNKKHETIISTISD